MRIQPKIIDHLGINMYTAIHPVLSELIANSWDADARNVYIIVPNDPISEKYSVIVRDDGSGMEYDELIDKYLQVGRNRRLDNQRTSADFTERTPKLNRRVLGRKGIGKLSVFGIARTVVFKSVKGGYATEFRMDLDKIKEEKTDRYKPVPLQVAVPTKEPNGVTVTLKNLNRKRRIQIEELRKGLARRFTVFGNNFAVHINETLITKKDREFTDIEKIWDVDEFMPGHPEWKVTGKIYAREATVPEQENRGVAIFVGGKLVQEPTLFKAGGSGKTYAYSHMLGEINAEFLDGENDVISTNRSSINWESEEGQALLEWGSNKIKKISTEWSEMRVEKKRTKFFKDKDFSCWYENLTKIQQRRAGAVVNGILGSEDLSDERTISLLQFIRNVFDYKDFQELAEEINKADLSDPSLLLTLFRDWEVLESREMSRIIEGRVATIEKLEWYIKNDIQEVPFLHNYLKKFPWIMDPRWTLIQDEARYSEILRKKFPDHDKDKRIDFLCFGSWPNVIVVEIKRPGVAIGAKELEQVREYVIAVEGLLGNDSEASYKKIYGYLICEEVQKSETNAKRLVKLQENGIFVRRYSELLSIARQTHREMIDAYRKIHAKTQ